MKGRKTVILTSYILLLALLVTLVTPTVSGQGMTIPTRTPKPDGEPPSEPTAEPTDDNGGGGGSNPPPTSEPDPPDGPEPTDEPVPLATATVAPTFTAAPATQAPLSSATPPPPQPTETRFVVVPEASGATPTRTPLAPQIEEAIIAFPEDGAPFPQAGPCDTPPTFTSLGAMSVYQGPATIYPLAGLLGAGEVRPIVGRAAFVEWWLIQLDSSGRVGWVSDAAGEVHGLINRVAIISAPELDGVAPTPGGTPWVPAAEEICDAPELIASGAVVASDSAQFSPPSGEPPVIDEVLPADSRTDSSSAIESEVGDAEGSQTVLAGGAGEADPLINDLAREAPPLALPASVSTAPVNLLPVAGLILIVAAVGIGMFARRNQSGEKDEAS